MTRYGANVLEIWKPVVGWEDSHEVSNNGQVKSISRKGSKQKLLSQRLVEKYPAVMLCANKKRKMCYVHHLVAYAFIGSPPSTVGTKRGQFTINHKDFDKTNNTVDNLEWLVCGDNYLHAFANGRVEVRKGSEVGTSKLDPMRVKEIKRRLNQGERPVDIAKDFGVVKGTIYAIKNGISWNEVL